MGPHCSGACQATRSGLVWLCFLLLSASALAQSLQSIGISPTYPPIVVGQSAAFKATGTFGDGSQRELGRAVSASVVATHACAVLDNGTVYCWGDNGVGQLGDGTLPPYCIGDPSIGSCDNKNEISAYLNAHIVPVAVSGISNAIAVDVGTRHACALLDDGTVRCWGDNTEGQLGDGTTTSSAIPVSVSGITTATAIAVGAAHNCALLADGTVKCWGHNGNGELGDDGAALGHSTTPVAVKNLSGVKAIAAGGMHVCALQSSGGVQCWGSSHNGQLGHGSNTRSFVPVAVSGISNAVAIGGGLEHTCVILATGTVKCWGDNAFDQLGDGNAPNDSTVPVTVSGLTGAIALAGSFSGYHTCVIVAGGTGKCWGRNASGQLGDGTTVQRSTPVTLGAVAAVSALAAGTANTCSIRTDGSLLCWGDNSSGQLGNGTTTPSLTAALVPGITVAWASSHPAVATIDASGVATGVGAGTATITATSGAVNATTTLTVMSKLSVSRAGTGTGSVKSQDGAIVCGVTCTALYASGTTVTLTPIPDLGSIFSGWIGDCSGTGPCTVSTATSKSVVALFDLKDFTASVSVTGGGSVISSPAGIDCPGTCTAKFPAGTQLKLTAAPSPGFFFPGWSGDCSGTAPCTLQLQADASVTAPFTLVKLTASSIASPGTIGVGAHRRLSAIGTFNDGSTRAISGSAIEAGDSFSCVRVLDGTVRCWGINAIGNGTMSSDIPVTVKDIATATALGAGTFHACAVAREPNGDSTVRCWGGNGNGQLGNGTTTDSLTPVGVSNITTAVSVVGGVQHSCALLQDGSVKCWGTGYGLTPVTVPGISGAVAISDEAGGNPCALLRNGDVYCWWGVGDSIGPAKKDGIANATDVASGPVHTCVLLASSGMKCWGLNLDGELGDGNTGVLSDPTPVNVIDIDGVKAMAIVAGDIHTCALRTDQTVSCWGDNGLLQLGSPPPPTERGTPALVPGLTGITSVGAGAFHTCAMKSDGTVTCWGDPTHGELGNGKKTDYGPVAVSNITTAIAVRWSSSNPAVAVVNARGHLTAVGPGTATITATITSTVPAITASTTVTVVNTAEGPNAVVQPVDAASGSKPVTLTFDFVSQPGTTTLTKTAGGPPPPTGFQLGSPETYYELKTTALFTGNIKVCIDFTGITFTSGSSPTIAHFEGGAWVKLATTVNGNVACATVTSLSPFALIERDTSPPVIMPLVSPTPNAAGWHNTKPVTVSWQVTDPQSSIAVSSGCAFATVTADTLGATFTCHATNGVGLSASASVTVKIDTVPPDIDCRADPARLWPPNHRAVPVTVNVYVLDTLSGPAGFTLGAATSSEPHDGLGDGDVPNDVQGFVAGTPVTVGTLPAERSGLGNGRVYTLSYIGKDVAGNASTCEAMVRVPHAAGR